MYHAAAKILGESICEDKEKQAVIIYGLEIIISSFVTFVILLLIGIYFHYVKEALLFTLLYCPLRQYAGGYHASSYINCTACMSGSFWILIHIWKMVITNMIPISVVIVSVLVFLFIWNVIPVQTKNKPLESYENKRYRKKGRGILTAEGCIGIFSILCSIKWIAWIQISVIYFIGVLLLVGMIKEKFR